MTGTDPSPQDVKTQQDLFNSKQDFQGGVTKINGKVISNNVYFQGDHITIDGANCIVTSLPNSKGSKLVK